MIFGMLWAVTAKAQIEIVDTPGISDFGLHLFEDSVIFEQPQDIHNLGDIVYKTIKSNCMQDWNLVYEVSPATEIDAIPKTDNDTIIVQVEGFAIDIWSKSTKHHTRIPHYAGNDTVFVSHSYEPESDTFTSKVNEFRTLIGNLFMDEKCLVAVIVEGGKLSSMRIVNLYRKPLCSELENEFDIIVFAPYPHEVEYNKLFCRLEDFNIEVDSTNIIHENSISVSELDSLYRKPLSFKLANEFDKIVFAPYPHDVEYNKSFCRLEDFNIEVDSTIIIYENPIPVSELDSLVNTLMKNCGYFSDSQFTYKPKGLSLKDFIQKNDTVYVCFRRQCTRDAYFWTTEFSTACGAHILRRVDNDSWGNITISKKEIYNQYNRQSYRKKFKFKYKIDFEPRYTGRLGQLKLPSVLWNNIKESNQANRFSLSCPLAYELMLVFIVKNGKIAELRTIDNLTSGARKYYKSIAEK